ncbi:MAG: hypothetical protein N3A69_18070, partial [Leptospiraceae bacterium]|nr:hypothetical protein [Leptospiraceae bacterium]
MWKIFKRFFKPKQDETIHNIIYSNSENWGYPFDKLSKTESKGSITEYLKKNPNKETLFLYHLEKNFEEFSARKQSFNLKSIFVLAGACFVLVALISNLYFINQKQANRNFQNDFTSKTIHFESLKVGQDISTENV